MKTKHYDCEILKDIKNAVITGNNKYLITKKKQVIEVVNYVAYEYNGVNHFRQFMRLNQPLRKQLAGGVYFYESASPITINSSEDSKKVILYSVYEADPNFYRREELT